MQLFYGLYAFRCDIIICPLTVIIVIGLWLVSVLTANLMPSMQNVPTLNNNNNTLTALFIDHCKIWSATCIFELLLLLFLSP